MSIVSRFQVLVLAALLTGSCGGLVPDGKSGKKEAKPEGGSCGIASCQATAVLDQLSCQCVAQDGKDDLGNGVKSCSIAACQSGFVLDAASCSCQQTPGGTGTGTGTGTGVGTGNGGIPALPEKGSYALLPKTGAPSGRTGHSAVWTGEEMIVWGGLEQNPNGQDTPLGDGAAFNPTTNTWRTLSATNAPSARYGHKAVWTGKYMAVVGKEIDVLPKKAVDGALYDPKTDTWKALNAAGAPAERAYYAVVAVAGKVVVWGGNRHQGGTTTGPIEALSSGGTYDPDANAWTAMTETGAPSPPGGHQKAFDGNGALLVFGGLKNAAYPHVVQFSATYDLGASAWTTLPAMSEETYQYDPSLPAVWTGEKLLYIARVDRGAQGLEYYLSSLDLAARSWTQKALGTSQTSQCIGVYRALWTGRYLFHANEGCLLDTDSGASFRTQAWPKDLAEEALPAGLASFRVNDQSAVWTGTEVLVFGGWYQASGPAPNCPEGAPCVPPEQFDGMALGARYTIGE